MLEEYQKSVIAVLLYCSVLALVTPAVIWLIRKAIPQASLGRQKKSTVSRMLIFSAYLMLAIWCLRYAVGCYEIWVPCEPFDGSLTWFEEIFNSIAHTLQSFSMDEDYTEYVLSGKKMMAAVAGERSPWITVYGVYSSVLNVIAIIAGGAILFELLASIFPKVRLHLSYLAFWREKYYFSELNEASVTLAQSICDLKFGFFKRPVIVFTDVYIDEKSENGSELLMEAKQLAAVCVRDDLAHVKKNAWGKRTFFLIDKEESGNLQALADLSNERNYKYLNKAEIFFFTKDDAYIQVEQRVRAKLEGEKKPEDEKKPEGEKKPKDTKKPKYKIDNMPTFIPVYSYRNLITNLLTDIPLYEPLVGKEVNADGNQTLTVTILGKGSIGMEMFLNTYWMGQMRNCDLKVRIISQETEETFWGELDYLNPEIKRTTNPDDSILEYNRKGEKAKVYCQVEYLQCDVKSTQFISYLTDPKKNILDTDYFLVSLGSDEVNISVAETLRKYVGKHHIHTQKSGNTVITYVVYDSELAQVLNEKKAYSFVGGKPDIYMEAIGSLHTVYSAENIFMTEHAKGAEEAHKAYLAVKNREARAKVHETRMEDDYKHWANLASAMHKNYKVYSMGYIRESIFDYPNEPHKHQEKMKEAYKNCCDLVTENKEKGTQQHLMDQMAWMEHRRWNAFTRIKGFQGTKDYKLYADPAKKGSYKQMDLKFHPCLVECDQKGMRPVVASVVKNYDLSQIPQEVMGELDLLDEVSLYLKHKGFTKEDMKKYDYPSENL